MAKSAEERLDWIERNLGIVEPVEKESRYPRVHVLGWPDPDGNFTLILEAIGQDSLRTRQTDGFTYYTVVPSQAERMENLGIRNLNEWYLGKKTGQDPDAE